MLATRFAKNRSTISASHGFLTEDQMRGIVPSIFAEEAHTSRSERYSYIPTIDIVRGLAKEGFMPTFACQAKPRDDDRRGFTKHMMRFRREADIAKSEAAEIIGINSHGGETSFQLLGGVFRFVCANGMIVGDKFEEVRVRHSGKIVNEVIEGAYRVVSSFERTMGAVDTMKQIAMRPQEQEALAEAASIMRFDLEEGEDSPVSLNSFLRARRSADTSNDLWSTFNRVQENTIRGGLHGVAVNANNQRRRITTREVNGIDQNVKLNRALWTLAERMAEIKAA